MSAPLRDKPGAWVDLALTLPIFLVYHLGVVFLDIHNATDVVTFQLMRLTEGSRPMYLLFTAAIGVVFAGVFAWLGRGQAFRLSKFVQIALEGIAYALLMRFAGGYVVAHLPGVGAGVAMTSSAGATQAAASLPALATGAAPPSLGPFAGVVMAFGAGFYEELAFRVILFGAGARLLGWILAPPAEGAAPSSLRRAAISVGWAFVSAAVFSAVHYTGALGESFQLASFVFRLVLGLVLTLIFAFRGFAAAVWAHAVYDVWVLV